MAERYKLASGIVIKRDSLPNGDVIISLFNQFGKLQAIAKKGNKLGGNIARMNLFNDLSVQYVKKDAKSLAILTQVQLNGSLSKLSSPKSYIYAHILAELVDKLTVDHFSDMQMYSYLASGLRGLSEYEDAETIAIIYAWKIIQQAGFAPRVKQCSICASKDLGNKFNLNSGGITCKKCDSGILISAEVLDYLQFLFNTTIRDMLEHKLTKRSEHWRLLRDYCGYHIAELQSFESLRYI